MLSLEGKVAMVTGAASGIGRGIALRLAEMGSAIVVVDIDSLRSADTVAQIEGAGAKAIFLQCDVRSSSQCHHAIERTIASYGRIDILCNNAGVIVRKDVTSLQEEDWDSVLEVTLKGNYLLCREVIPHMIRQGGGSIINTASGWALKGGPKAASYCAAKAGVLNLTRAMAIDHGKDNIRINCICPGDIDTPMLAAECRQLGEDPEQFMKAAALRPLNRVGKADDVADAVLFFASNMSKWVTGAYLVVDGGGLA